MSEVLNIYVRGEPQPRPRARARAIPIGGKWNGQQKWTATFYDLEKVDGKTLPWVYWRTQLEFAIRSKWHGEKLDEPIRLDIDFYFSRPQYLLKPSSPRSAIRMSVKPDVDNCAKLVMDVITDADVWLDDGRVCCGEWCKWYAAIGDSPGARIVVSTLSKDDPALFGNTTESMEMK
jgi:Holliday junction resolvase RusA-like endonuclease